MQVRHGAATVTGERPSPMTTVRKDWKVEGTVDPGVRILTAALPTTGREHPGEERQMQHRPLFPRLARALMRTAAVGLLWAAAPAALISATSGPSAAASSGPASGSCSGVPGAHHARVVVEASSHSVVQRCVGFSSSSIPALTLLRDAHVQLGTQKFSFGIAICQVNHVPSHYTQCLPSGQDYWSLFLSTNGRRWTSPATGVSDIKVPAGGSLGLRYDSPKGNPAAPPPPTPA